MVKGLVIDNDFYLTLSEQGMQLVWLKASNSHLDRSSPSASCKLSKNKALGALSLLQYDDWSATQLSLKV
jgi:hypothetical protein